MGQLAEWRRQNWVRIGTDGSIKGPCGTSKDKKNPDRCLPKSKAQSLSKAERAKTARKKKHFNPFIFVILSGVLGLFTSVIALKYIQSFQNDSINNPQQSNIFLLERKTYF
mgnify:CR=1 FL=1